MVESEFSLSLHLQDICIKNKLTLFGAESCTGGLFSQIITKNNGSSKYFLGSIVAYDNFIKEEILSVKKETLQKFGAVSQECVVEMALGAQKISKASLTASISGIAGPSGALENKAIGFVCFAVAFQIKFLAKNTLFQETE